MTKKIIRRQVADKTRAKIIKAAYRLFAEQGYSGAATLSIAKLAKVNETLIFHHFGSKAELWKKVKEDVVTRLALDELDAQPKSLREFLDAVITQRIALFSKEPNLARLLQWQRLESKQAKLAAGNKIAPTNWLEPILYLQKKGKIKNTINPGVIISWLAASINAVTLESNPFLQSEKHLDEYIAFIADGFEKVLA